RAVIPEPDRVKAVGSLLCNSKGVSMWPEACKASRFQEGSRWPRPKAGRSASRHVENKRPVPLGCGCRLIPDQVVTNFLQDAITWLSPKRFVEFARFFDFEREGRHYTR